MDSSVIIFFAKVVKKCHNSMFSSENIWWNGKKSVPLQPLLRVKSMEFKLKH